jgi:hypothetical protein
MSPVVADFVAKVVRRQLGATDEQRVAIRPHGRARKIAHLLRGDAPERRDIRRPERVEADGGG